VLFFVSVGMLFDPAVLVEHPGKVLVVVAIIMIGKTLAAIALVLLFGYNVASALTVGVSLAQIGEFSFILAALGVKLELLPGEGQSLILAGALISISLNSLLFAGVAPVARRLARWSRRGEDELGALPMSVPQELLSGQIVLVGYGRVGRRIAAALDEADVPYIVAEDNREVVEELRRRGKPLGLDDAALPEVLVQAHIATAAMLVIAAPDSAGTHRMIEIARRLNAPIEIVVRTHSEEVAAALEKGSAGAVFMGEHELALAMSRHVLQRMGLR